MLNGPKCMVMCQKWCNALGVNLKNGFVFAISHTLAGKLGLWGLTGQLTPLIIFTSSGLVLATRQVDKQVSFQAPHALAHCGRHEQFDT